MARPPARTRPAVGDALTRAAQDEGAKLPSRFTAEKNPDNSYSQRITDTVTGLHSDVMLTCFGTVRRVLSELFPEP